MDHPPFLDIRDLESRLAHDTRFRPLKRMIGRTLLAQSCTADLDQARDCIEVLDSLNRYFGKRSSPPRISIEAALLTTAVMLYARATGGSDSRGERGSIKIASKLTAEQLDDLEAILRLRNRAFAHVYPNEPVADDLPWHRDLIFAVATDHGWKPGAATNRLQFSPAVVARLRRQIAVAKGFMYQRFQQRMAELTELMNSLPIDVDHWISSFFDPVQVFGSEEAVEQVLAGMGEGLTAFYTRG